MSNRDVRQKREWSATSEPILIEAESMPALPCASMFEGLYWPEYEGKSSQPVYNCIQYELSDGEHVVMSADAKGIHARGCSAEEAIEDFRSAIKTHLADKLGGLYSGTSDIDFRDRIFHSMEEGWNDDDVQILTNFGFLSDLTLPQYSFQMMSSLIQKACSLANKEECLLCFLCLQYCTAC